MNARSYFLVTVVVFALIAIAHLIRVVGNLPLTFGSISIPAWTSVVAAIVAAALSIWGMKLSRQ